MGPILPCVKAVRLSSGVDSIKFEKFQLLSFSLSKLLRNISLEVD